MKITISKDDGEVLEIYDLKELTIKAAYSDEYIDVHPAHIQEAIDEEITSDIKCMLPIWRNKHADT